jgi:predicted nucleotidyltransferase
MVDVTDDPSADAPTPASSRGGLPAGVTSGSLWEAAGRRGVIRMRLVGSWALGEAKPTDPVEIVVGYQKRPPAIETVRLQLAFEELTGHRFIVREETTVTGAERDRLRRGARML